MAVSVIKLINPLIITLYTASTSPVIRAIILPVCLVSKISMKDFVNDGICRHVNQKQIFVQSRL